MYLLTLLSPMLIPSLRSSPWMRGAPQPGFSRHIWRIRSRTSRAITGRPGWPRRTFQVQNRRKPDDARPRPFPALRWPEPNASRSRGGTARPTAGGSLGSTCSVFSRSAAARRFGHRSRTKHGRQSAKQCPKNNQHREENSDRKYNSHPLRHFEIFERHNGGVPHSSSSLSGWPFSSIFESNRGFRLKYYWCDSSVLRHVSSFDE
jgi:hypothetical protein